jgi:hypothetical protein
MNTLKQAVEAAKTKAKKNFETDKKDQRFFVYLDRESSRQSFHLVTDQNYYAGIPYIDEEDVKALVFYGTGGYPEKPAYDVEYY